MTHLNASHDHNAKPVPGQVHKMEVRRKDNGVPVVRTEFIRIKSVEQIENAHGAWWYCTYEPVRHNGTVWVWDNTRAVWGACKLPCEGTNPRPYGVQSWAQEEAAKKTRCESCGQPGEHRAEYLMTLCGVCLKYFRKNS